MGNMLHQWRKGVAEMKESVKLSELFSTVQQRKGDRFVKLFMASFAISMMIVVFASILEFLRTLAAVPDRERLHGVQEESQRRDELIVSRYFYDFIISHQHSRGHAASLPGREAGWPPACPK